MSAADNASAEDHARPSPVSPCLGICLLDPRTRMCRGCLRTVEEIAAWYNADNAEKRWVQVLLRPGLALQSLTTREPDLDQLQVAIAALEAALAEAPQPVASTSMATVSPLVAQPLSA